MKTEPSTEKPLSFEEKKEILKRKLFSLTTEEKYTEIIRMGRDLPPSGVMKTNDSLVSGCQSKLYLYSWTHQKKVFFSAEGDALIANGLAALLIYVYSGESPELILTHPPDYLNDLDIHASLSMNRSNGLSNIYLRMRQEALKYLLEFSDSK